MINSSTTSQLFTHLSNNKRLFIIFLLGFSAGLPASLIASTLQAWFTDMGLELKTIGAVTLLVAPYSLRFLWAPLFDYYRIPGLDRRRSWLLILQIGLLISISSMAYLEPGEVLQIYSWQIPKLMILGVFTSFFSASLEIIINAYQTEILPPQEQGFGASLYVTGWRIGSILSGALALVLAKEIGWQTTYLSMALLISVGLFATLIAPASNDFKVISQNLPNAVIEPFKAFIVRFGWKTTFLFFLLILSYKATDAIALALNTTFLLREVGFDLTTVGLVNKTISIFSAIGGGIFAGILMKRISLYWAVFTFGFIQGAANLSYAILAYWGKSIILLVFTAFTENFCSGMGTIALIALIMALADKRYTATQIAILSALAYLARPLAGPLAVSMVEAVGWVEFFVICFLLSLPTLLITYVNKDIINQLREDQNFASRE